MGEAVTDELIEVEQDRVIQFKVQWLVYAGFSKRNAELIATSDVDWHSAIDLLDRVKKKGYDDEYVVKILL